jgi:hypothetical protein
VSAYQSVLKKTWDALASNEKTRWEERAAAGTGDIEKFTLFLLT